MIVKSSVAWIGALLYLSLSVSSAFKDAEFKKCGDSAFCKRLRGNPGDGFEIDPKSVAVKGAELTASLRNPVADKQFVLKLTAYDGLVRLHIDESGNRGRFQVPFVLMETLASHLTPWKKVKSSKSGTEVNLGDATVSLTYKPLKLEVKRGRDVLVNFNSRSMFQMEHLREKQEGDPEGWWQETFKSHTDSKPKGPQSISLDISFPGAHHVYGIPEHAKSLSLPPTIGEGIESEPYRLFNLDVFEYLQDSPFGLYGAIPFMTAHKPRFTTGVFWLNAAEMLVDVEKSETGTDTQWMAESGVVDLFILLGPSPKDVLKQYSLTTGTTQMPQYFALGYHQCRWNYRDEADVKRVDTTMDLYDIPYDVIWLDIEHTEGKRYFTWDAAHFPHPKEMQAGLAEHGRKLVTIIDPHIKKDDNYYVYKEATSQGFLTKNKDGNDFDGWCWPGSSVYIDMMNPKAVTWWGTQFQLSKYQGSTADLYVWNDMNEPSVFNGPEISMPRDALHFGGVEHRDLHNLHGLLFHKATALGLTERGAGLSPSGDRSFVLTRSFYAGSQRWGPMWTGDNAATWESLQVSVPMLLASGLAGYPWAGADVGGFFGNPDAELYTRWYQVGAYYPFFRGHAHLDAARREPWVYGEPTTSRVKEAIQRRYALLPYIYTTFQQSHEDGSPIMRPLWYEFPTQEELFDVDDSFMVGPALLLAPVTHEGQTSRNVTLPAGSVWYRAATGELEVSAGEKVVRRDVAVTLDDVPAYLRGGTIIPTRQRTRRSTAAAASDPFTLIVVLDGQGSGTGSLYLDDGRSFAYEKGSFSKSVISFKDGFLSNKVFASGYDKNLKVERIVILGLGKPGSRWRAENVGAKQSLETRWGPLYLKPGLPHVALHIRMPNLSVVEEWSLKLKQ